MVVLGWGGVEANMGMYHGDGSILLWFSTSTGSKILNM
jgi:hypothetical protein